MRTKTSLLRRNKIFQINYHFRYLKVGFISQFQFIPFKNKLLSLIHFSNGSLSYFVTTQNHCLFSFFYLNREKKLIDFFGPDTFSCLVRFKITNKVCLIEITPGKGSQYCRSSGTYGKIIKFDLFNFAVLIKLPSGCRKIFSYYSFAAVGQVSLKKHASFLNSKAGY
jgi:ribosomal protein L2